MVENPVSGQKYWCMENWNMFPKVTPPWEGELAIGNDSYGEVYIIKNKDIERSFTVNKKDLFSSYEEAKKEYNSRCINYAMSLLDEARSYIRKTQD